MKIMAALLCAPCAADAQQLLIEYRGTVSSVDRGTDAVAPQYAVGDSIGGTLLIDARSAPEDRLAGDPTIGRYSSGIDFILGPSRPLELGRSNADLLLVYDDWTSPAGAAPQDGILIHDRSSGSDGEFNLVLGLLRPNLVSQLFSNDGLSQSFAVEREAGVDLWGYIEEGFGEFWSGVTFALDRIAVRPGVCST